MDAATMRRAGRFPAFLAGLQAGMLGALWMLAWLGLSDVWKQRSFWSSENLMATVFYGGAAIRSGFAGPTLSGLALDLLLYSLLGALFALAVHRRFRPLRVVVASLAFAVGWYYLSFHLIWKAAGPLVALLHAERPTLFGHVIYGACLARFPLYVVRAATPPAQTEPAEAAELAEAAAEPVAPDTNSEGPGQQ